MFRKKLQAKLVAPTMHENDKNLFAGKQFN